MASAGATGDGAVPSADAVLRRFLSVVEPTLHRDTEHDTGDGDAKDAGDVPLSAWELLYSTSGADALDLHALAGTPDISIVVRTHPDTNTPLFSVQAYLPDLCARRFWTLMAESENRHLWDATIQNTDIRALGTDAAAGVDARIELLTFGAIFMVTKARDMVLLSVDTQLPPTSASAPSTQTPPAPPLRLLSASQSITNADFPPRKKYTRFHLGIGGFLVEDVPAPPSPDGGSASQGGIVVTQLSDLGPAATWLPSSIIKMVASTLVPRSLAKIADCARTMTIPAELNGNDDSVPAAEATSKAEGDTAAGQEGGRVTRQVGVCGEVWEVGRRLPPTMTFPSPPRSPASPPSPLAKIANAARSIFLPSAADASQSRTLLSGARSGGDVTSLDASMAELSLSPPTSPARAPGLPPTTPVALREPPQQTSPAPHGLMQGPPGSSQRGDKDDDDEENDDDDDDEGADNISVHLADAIADELDRIALHAADTLRTCTLATGRRAKTQRAAAAAASARSIPSAFLPPPAERREKARRAGLQRAESAGLGFGAVGRAAEGEEGGARTRKERRRASRRLLDSSGVCAMLLAPGLASTSEIETDAPQEAVLPQPDATRRRSVAEVESEAHASRILRAYRAGVEEEVRVVTQRLEGMQDESDGEDEHVKEPAAGEQVDATPNDAALIKQTDVSSLNMLRAWWPSFGLLWGVLPIVSWAA